MAHRSPSITGSSLAKDVLQARAGRAATVQELLATVTADDLAATRRNPCARPLPVSLG